MLLGYLDPSLQHLHLLVCQLPLRVTLPRGRALEDELVGEFVRDELSAPRISIDDVDLGQLGTLDGRGVHFWGQVIPRHVQLQCVNSRLEHGLAADKLGVTLRKRLTRLKVSRVGIFGSKRPAAEQRRRGFIRLRYLGGTIIAKAGGENDEPRPFPGYYSKLLELRVNTVLRSFS